MFYMATKVTPQDYKGMDLQTLNMHRQQLLSTKACHEYCINKAKETLKKCKAEIKESVEGIKLVEAELAKLQEAYEMAKEVIYEPVVFIRKRIASAYIGYGAPVYFSPSAWKDYVVYYYEVHNVNILGANKGKVLVEKSRDYDTEEKAEFNADVLKVMLKYKTTKIHLEDGAKVNTTLLKKSIANLTIV